MAVRDSSVVGGSGVTSQDTDPFSVVAGDTISVWFNYGNTTDPVSVTDDLGNVYTQRRKVSHGFTSWRYDCVSVATGPCVVSLDIGVTEFPTLAAASISGLDAAPLDVDVQLDNDTTQPWSLATGTLAQADEDVLAWIGADSGTPTDVFVEGSGMAILGQISDSSAYWTGALAYRAVNSTVSYAPSFTNAAGGANSALITTTFKRSGSSPATVEPSSIASGEAWGAAAATVDVAPSGIAPSGAVGAPTLVADTAPGGITSGEAWGTPSVGGAAVTVAPEGITSGEGWGTPNVAGAGATVSPEGIASSAAMGAPTLAANLEPAGMATAEAWGAPGAVPSLQPSGIVSGEAWGVPAVTVGPVTVSPVGIVSGEAWGTPQVGSVIITGPTEWIYTTLPAERRVSTIAAETRQAIVAGESRTTEVPPHA